MWRKLKRFPPFRDIARLVDLHFSTFDRVLGRIEDLHNKQELVAARQAQLAHLLSQAGETAQAPEPAAESQTIFPTLQAPPSQDLPLFDEPVDLIVTHNEVNTRHGTGVLVQRLFRQTRPIVALRATNTFGAEQDFGALQFCLPRLGMQREEIYRQVLSWLGGVKPRTLISVPFASDDLTLSIAVKDIFRIPFCLYIMDDQNVCEPRIPDELMSEAIEKADLRLAISPEMQVEYQNKYRRRFWLLPPVVSDRLILREPPSPRTAAGGSTKSGVIVGNIWSQHWLDLVRKTVRGSQAQVDWYCNCAKPPWLTFDIEDLERDGIRFHGPEPEDVLAAKLRECDFALLPSGSLDKKDPNYAVARLSLPSRVPFVVASSGAPIIALGSPDTAVAGFLKRFDVGVVCPYDSEAFQSAIAEVTRPERLAQMRANAGRIGASFSDQQAGAWIYESLARGEPADRRYEDLMPFPDGTLVYYVDEAAPAGTVTDLVPIYQALRRLKSSAGFEPDFVVDVGASTGVWSGTVSRLFPQARFILIDALVSRYPQSHRYYMQGCKYKVIEAAVSDRPGRMKLQITEDLYNSSLLYVSQIATVEAVTEVVVTTLDNIAQEEQIEGRGLLKIDVQHAEHLILAGGRDFIANHVDVVVLELTMVRPHPEARTFREMLNLMSDLGFEFNDDAGEWRSPRTGALDQKDALFIRRQRST